jgi:polar amino acid transport system substrate-binding protein
LAIGRAPLADEHLPDGGLITALIRTSLSTTETVAGPLQLEVRWTKAALPPMRSLLSDVSIDISWPWESADCEQPNDLEQTSAVLCDNAVYSEPILQVVVGLFMMSDNAFKFENDESIFGRTICVPLNQDVSALNGQGRNWLSQKRVVALRQPTLLDCVSAVQKLEADAFVANDLEGRYVLARLGLAQSFRMAERPLGTRGVHAIVSKQNSQASELIEAVNRGLKQLKQTDSYAAIVRRHLMQLWDAK